jgi:hypothetical protein
MIFTVTKNLFNILTIEGAFLLLLFHWLRLKGINSKSKSSPLVQDFPPFPSLFPYFVYANQHFN